MYSQWSFDRSNKTKHNGKLFGGWNKCHSIKWMIICTCLALQAINIRESIDTHSVPADSSNEYWREYWKLEIQELVNKNNFITTSAYKNMIKIFKTLPS